jgi:hypothetical protein
MSLSCQKIVMKLPKFCKNVVKKLSNICPNFVTFGRGPVKKRKKKKKKKKKKKNGGSKTRYDFVAPGKNTLLLGGYCVHCDFGIIIM